MVLAVERDSLYLNYFQSYAPESDAREQGL
jgi:hypothetical protein